MATFSKRVTFVIWNRIGFLEGILPVFFELKQQYPNIHFVILILELNKEYGDRPQQVL
jgi:ADP-heptose:LPS heptosyltransferase